MEESDIAGLPLKLIERRRLLERVTLIKVDPHLPLCSSARGFDVKAESANRCWCILPEDFHWQP